MEEPHLAVYDSYLIRLWRDAPNLPWRASAQSVVDGSVVRFASLSALYAFLDARAGVLSVDGAVHSDTDAI